MSGRQDTFILKNMIKIVVEQKWLNNTLCAVF